MLHLSVDRVLSHLQQQAPRFSGFDSQRCCDRARELADSFSSSPIPPIILLAEPEPLEFLATFLAAVATHCPLFLGNPNWQQREWQQVFEIVQPDLIFGRPHFPVCRTDLTVARSSLTLQNPIYIPTGGTSGRVKFAAHTWETLTRSIEGFCQYFEVNIINSFCVLPLFHVSGLMQFLRSFLTAGCFYYCPYSDLKKSQEIAINPENYFISLVPTQLQFLLDNRAQWLSRFQTVMLGGAPAWGDLLTKARERKIRLAPTYGMTETASQVATLKPTEFLEGEESSGRVLPHARVKILKATKEGFNLNGVGTIAIEAKSLFLGYYPDLQPRDRVYFTDDLGYFDDRGYLHLLGRNSQKIITGGENVFPGEVEAAILATQLVVDVCAIGIPDKVWGQAVTAVYVPKTDRVTVREIQVAISTQISPFKQPKYWVDLERLPRNDRGKLDSKQILQIALKKLHPSHLNLVEDR